MITAEKFLRNSTSFKYRRTRILWIFQKVIIKCLIKRTVIMTEYSRNKSCYGIHDGHSGKFTACKNEIPERNLTWIYHLYNTLIYSLVMAAEKDNILIFR